jgi:hypothetical protein
MFKMSSTICFADESGTIASTLVLFMNSGTMFFPVIYARTNSGIGSRFMRPEPFIQKK